MVFESKGAFESEGPAIAAFLPEHSQDPSEQKCIKNLGASVGVSRDFPIFGGTPVISGMGKATNFKFGQNVYGFHMNKCPLKILEKRE